MAIRAETMTHPQTGKPLTVRIEDLAQRGLHQEADGQWRDGEYHHYLVCLDYDGRVGHASVKHTSLESANAAVDKMVTQAAAAQGGR